jgi:hypothetical protein
METEKDIIVQGAQDERIKLLATIFKYRKGGRLPEIQEQSCGGQYGRRVRRDGR